MSELFWVQLLVVLVCIGVGGRYGGVGLGAAGGLGVCILTLLFGLQPASPPIAVLLIIIAVIACTSVLQGAGGLDFLVRVAENTRRRKDAAEKTQCNHLSGPFHLLTVCHVLRNGLCGFCRLPGGGRSCR